MRPYVLLAVTGIIVVFAGFISPEFPPLSDSEKEGIMLMREEEKMAFDVYSAMYRKWDHHVFLNISQSEAHHSDLVEGLIIKFKLEDPVMEAEGQFKNQTLQTMYNDLVKKGQNSLIDAFEVGAMIEDLDIYDLEKQLDKTKNTDIKEVYQSLLSASRNHLRAFSRQLDSRDKPYEPRHLSKAAFETITKSEHETCTYANSGKGNRYKKANGCGMKDRAGCPTKGNSMKSCSGKQAGVCCSGNGSKKACAGKNAGF